VLVLVGERAQRERDRSGWLDGLADAGIAAFTWDRPGPGEDSAAESGRDVPQVRAREVLAALARLRWLPEVQPTAMALLGFGTGGWAAAQAATFGGDARALILACTPMVSEVELAEHRFAGRLRAAGLGAQDVQTAREVLRRRLHRLIDGDTVAEVAAAEQGHRASAWYRLLPAAGQVGDVAGPAPTADPRPTLSAVTVPVLAMFGELDPLTPLQDSVRGVRMALRAARHRDHEVAVVRGADHTLRVRPGHGLGAMAEGRHRFADWPAGLTAFLAGWLAPRIHPVDEIPGFVPPATMFGGHVTAGLVSGTTPAGPGVTGPCVPGQQPCPPGQHQHGPRQPGRPALPVPVRQLRRRVTR
jgi:hypothetical protein